MQSHDTTAERKLQLSQSVAAKGEGKRNEEKYLEKYLALSGLSGQTGEEKGGRNMST